MDELRRIIRIFMDRFFPRTYDYHDYSDRRGIAAVGAAAGGEEEAKAQKVKILAGIILLAGIPLSFYVYNLRDDYRAGRRSSPASQAAEPGEEEGVSPSVLSPNQSLDDLRRWAAGVEREAQRGALDTMPRVRGVAPSAGTLSLYEEDMGDPWAEEAAMRRRERTPIRDTAPLFPEFATVPGPTPVVTPPPADRVSPIEATTTVPVTVAAPALDAGTTTETPYHRRRYEPIIVDPRAVDPY